MRTRIALIVALAMAAGALAAPVRAQEEWVTERVYIPMPDGAKLAAVVARPHGDGPFPVALTYDPYAVGSSGVYGFHHPDFFVPHGYAFVAVSIRGTGCSSGEFDQVFSQQEARDGAAAVEWAAGQRWSTGDVALVGASYPGIDQFFVAAQHPRGLKAITPLDTLSDIYRDVVYPGGIFNPTFAAGWSLGFQPYFAAVDGPLARVPEGDDQCAANFADQASRNFRSNVGAYFATHPVDNDFYASRSPKSVIDDVDVPVFMAQGWQDHQVGSRGLQLYDRIRTPKKLTVSNGLHGIEFVRYIQREVIAWLDYWLKGEDNGIMDGPPVTVLFETGRETREPNFVHQATTWPLDGTTFTPLYLREGGALEFDAPASAEQPDAYPYLAGAGPGTAFTHDSIGDFVGEYSSESGGVPPSGLLIYETAPLEEGLMVAGPAELVLHGSTTAVDTDWFVSLSEVDPDGNVTFVQKGMLRASHRDLDAERSAPGRPYHWHTNPSPVVPGDVHEYRVEILPFGHVFRAGTKLRLDFLTPSVLPEFYWGYMGTPLPAVNFVHHAPGAESHLLLPVVARGGDYPDAPACGAAMGMSCRRTIAGR